MSTVKATNIQHLSSVNPNIVLGSTGGVSIASTVSVGTTIYVPSINDGPLSGTRNRIINGGMQVWQRATTATGNYSSAFTYATVDRWAVYSGNTSTTLAQSTSVPASTGNTFQYSVVMQRPSGSTATGIIFIGQGIESVNCYDLSNQQVTLSFWAKAGANYSGGSLSVSVITGTVADQGIAVNNGWTGRGSPLAFSPSITTTWTKYTLTGTFGSGVLETLVQFGWTPSGTAGADDAVYITGVQLEAGTVATPFERRSIGQELALCQRYYYKAITPAASRYGVGHNTSTTVGVYVVVLPVTMRVAPTSMETTGTATDYDIQYLNSAITCSTVPSFGTASQNIMTVAAAVASGLTAGQGSNLRSTTATSFLAFSAEL